MYVHVVFSSKEKLVQVYFSRRSPIVSTQTVCECVSE